MKKFFAVARRRNDTSPMRITLEAVDYRQALDDMFYYLNTDSFGVEEYEMYEIVGTDRYVPVASKIKPSAGTPTPVVETKVVEEATFKEKLYTSYRDVA